MKSTKMRSGLFYAASSLLWTQRAQGFSTLSLRTGNHHLLPKDHYLLAAPRHLAGADNREESNPDKAAASGARRSFFSAAAIAIASASLAAPPAAHAGIDVTGLPLDTASSTRAQQIQAAAAASWERSAPASAPPASVPPRPKPVAADGSPVATYATRRLGTLPATVGSVGLTGLKSRFAEQLYAPEGSVPKYVSASFEFPSDWLQLDRLTGGIQYVDQRNGDKLYLLRVALPEGTTLETVPKKFFGPAIFDPAGDLVRGGNAVEDYRVSSSVLSSQIVPCSGPGGACSIPRRRLTVKYSTVTGNGLSVERRGLVDAYEVDGEAYMLMTSSNAVKFDAKGKERETVEAIVDSFRIER
uniref:Uncharacterized protein n=1 Tax=Trieres chinensis TaxID=1514140 RepID=A0A7S2EWI7_TRICV|mmetsp:Transcript_7952/g.16844  ORF Transcript_7952/g.16844 Transcript_7952/m.16844 type:complete len:357 (+) Transcript_7952:102-1172(+)